MCRMVSAYEIGFNYLPCLSTRVNLQTMCSRIGRCRCLTRRKFQIDFLIQQYLGTDSFGFDNGLSAFSFLVRAGVMCCGREV